MNKGLELIEAHHLFALSPQQIGVVVHPDAIVHAIAQWRDGAITAGLAAPDMRIPIANALGFERRLEMPYPVFDFAGMGSLRFERPDEERFPCLKLAREVMFAGGVLPAAMNAANEVAVAAYSAGQIGFYDIHALVSSVCEFFSRRTGAKAPANVEEALAIHKEATVLAEKTLNEFISIR
jgi:1-deoxy-D-xylulose 5-phosphate reductoisomerase